MNRSAADSGHSASRLRITEIFYSLQGEALTVGCPTIFIRLTGCPLRCGYCDTEYAFTGGQWMEQEEVLKAISAYNTPYVTVTGGEPLAQKNCLPLLTALCDAGYRVSLETSGALDMTGVDSRVVKVMDLKTPGSGEVERNRFENIDLLGEHDLVKFVICDEPDYQWAKAMLEKYQLADKCSVLFSPGFNELKATDLADWVLRDQLPVRMQLQLHKILWGNTPGR